MKDIGKVEKIGGFMTCVKTVVIKKQNLFKTYVARQGRVCSKIEIL
jgi:hypothetical protein